ncbi:MAG: GNAT family N-acetyltransferase [Ardenticatenaceae bacterium]|nr:GNAT family N-acetyltransferase [Ardenticatenaceae bacterium]
MGIGSIHQYTNTPITFSMRTMPNLTTERLLIRPVREDEAEAIYQHNRAIGWVNESQIEAEQREAAYHYARWLSLNHLALARLHQPPYGDRVIALRETDELMGMCGLVPYISDFTVFPSFGGTDKGGLAQAEVGLMWAISPAYWRQGYGSEAAQALVTYAFTEMRLHRLIATTEHDNLASQAVMRKLGMRLEVNPYPEPPWHQVLGILTFAEWEASH